MQVSVTEALAEIKLIEKKIAAKQQVIAQAATRYEHQPDTLGDSKAKIKEELQAVRDLQKRHVTIRGKIARANLETLVKIGDDERSVYDWLVWKREIAQNKINFLSSVRGTVKSHVDMTQKGQPNAYRDDKGELQLVKVQVNVDVKEILSEEQACQEALDKLDGLLSLKNATVMVDI